MPRLFVPFFIFVALASSMSAAGANPMTAAEALALPQPEADARIAYADHEHAFGELRLPPGDGPHPVVMIIHGGCWLAAYDLGYMSGLAAAITAEGFATWSIEYRRVGDEGGGWPGTFIDVAAAADQLRAIADRFPLDVDRIVVVGHSAGGHLALWLAARHGLPASDPLRGNAPLPLHGVLSLAGITDLAAYASTEGCGAAVPDVLGGPPELHPERLQRASPIEMLPLGVPQVLISGELDTIVPQKHAQAYAANGEGDSIRTMTVPAAGHFELTDPTSAAWPFVRQALLALTAK